LVSSNFVSGDVGPLFERIDFNLGHDLDCRFWFDLVLHQVIFCIGYISVDVFSHAFDRVLA
jgi:hypothetical protein